LLLHRPQKDKKDNGAYTPLRMAQTIRLILKEINSNFCRIEFCKRFRPEPDFVRLAQIQIFPYSPSLNPNILFGAKW
jgi:hypothetical protein